MKTYFIDSFTEQPFKGNPAAVVLQDKAMPDKLLQSIAQEIGFSETAFLLKADNGDYTLRWFTPTTEVGLCGHATLATAKVFFTYLKPEEQTVTFNTKYGKLSCYQDSGNIRMDFPRDKVFPIEKYNELKDFFAFSIKNNILFSKVNKYLLVLVEDSINLADLSLDINKLLGISAVIPEIRGLIISNRYKDTIQLRFFDPWEGIPEDPVTGSAALVISEYWCDLLDSDFLKIEQMSSRGGKMQIVREKEHISITGKATIILEGKLIVGEYGE